LPAFFSVFKSLFLIRSETIFEKKTKQLGQKKKDKFCLVFNVHTFEKFKDFGNFHPSLSKSGYQLTSCNFTNPAPAMQPENVIVIQHYFKHVKTICKSFDGKINHKFELCGLYEIIHFAKFYLIIKQNGSHLLNC